MDDTARLLLHLLMWVVFPLWVASGVADWVIHRREHLELNAGVPEALMHLVMLGELGIGVVAAAALEPTTGLLLGLAVLCVLHDVTMAWDLRYAHRTRGIPPAEQWVHALQQSLPWVALGLLAVAHRDALTALWDGRPDWRLVPREVPVPRAAWAVIGLSGAAFAGLFGEETWRARRVAAAAGRPGQAA